MAYWSDPNIASNYADLRPSVPEEFMTKIRDFYCETNAMSECVRIVDVGCGPGIATTVLAATFPQAKVVGLDLSLAQVIEAKQRFAEQDIDFRQHDIDSGLPFDDVCLDLIVSTTAVHWLDLEKFMSEVKRTLKPNGVLAIGSYGWRKSLRLPGSENNETLNAKLDAAVSEMEAALNEYHDERHQHMDDQYARIIMPYQQQTKEYRNDCRIAFTVQMSISERLQWMYTESVIENYKKANPKGSQPEEYIQRVTQIIAEHTGQEADLVARLPMNFTVLYFLKMCRKPSC